MASRAFKTQATALVLALAAQGAHAGLTVTSMSQTASATASAQHSYTTVTPGYSCCANTTMVGPVDKQVDTSPAGALGTLNQQTSARAEAEGIIAEAQSTAHIKLLENGFTVSSSGSARHVFPSAVDVGPGGAAANSASFPSYDLELMHFSAATRTRSAMSGVQQTLSFHLSEDTQLRVDWSNSGDNPNYFDEGGFVIEGVNNTSFFYGGFGSILPGQYNSPVMDMVAGDYNFRLSRSTGVTQFTPGEMSLNWQGNMTVRAVPEASTWAMMGLGLAAMCVVARRRSVSGRA